MRGKIILTLLLSLTIVSAEACGVTVTLLNQDPFPAVPGEYVKLVFQLSNLNSRECGRIEFELLEEYPIRFDPGKTGKKSFEEVDYIRGHETRILVPYEVRIDPDALDGASPIEVTIKNKNSAPILSSLDLTIEDVRTDFEIYVKNYNYATNQLTLEVLNIGKVNVEALTLEIPKQEIINVKGHNRVIVGDLDSNEYTTADFEAVLTDGEFQVNLIYSDAIKTRRTVEKTVTFNKDYFTNRMSDKKTTSLTTYFIWIVILALIGWFIYKKISKSRKKKKDF
jgi:hypothetical protein